MSRCAILSAQIIIATIRLSSNLVLAMVRSQKTRPRTCARNFPAAKEIAAQKQ